MAHLDLHSDFPDVSSEDWETLTAKGLRDESLESLTQRTEEGLTRGPLSSQ